MPPTNSLIRISDGTMCSAWGGAFFNGQYYYNLLSHYEDARHFRYATQKDDRDLEDGKIKYKSGSDALASMGENRRGIIFRGDEQHDIFGL